MNQYRLLTPDAQYADDGTIERKTAGQDVQWDIQRTRTLDQLSADSLGACDAVVVWHEMKNRPGFRRGLEAVPDHRPRRGRLRSHRSRRGGGSRNSRSATRRITAPARSPIMRSG